MSQQSGFQVSDSAAALYERYAVRYFIGPWAPGLVEVAALQRGQRVLDLACGTGVVARLAAAKVQAAGHVTGLDINAGMIAVARSLPIPEGAAITWVESSAAATALPDDSFDVAFCQQGLQFFPDKPATLKEVRRVLVPGGRAVFSVWKSMGPYNAAAGDALEHFAGLEAATRFRASRADVPDSAELRRLFLEAGFRDVEIRTSTMSVHLPAIEDFVLRHLSGMPVAGALAALSEDKRTAFGRQVKSALQPYVDGDGVTVPDEVNIAIARK